MTPFRKFVFCATDFYLANGIPKWIFLLHGCRTNQINIYSPKGGSVKPFFGTFLLCFNFLDFLDFLSHGMNSKMDFPLAQIWSLSISQRTPKMSCIGNCIKKLWLRSALCILRNGFLSGERNSKMDFPFAWMSNESNKHTLQRAVRSNHFLVLFCYVSIFWIF